MSTIKSVLVVGAGTMGCQIAAQCAAHGVRVAMTDADANALDVATARLAAINAARAEAGVATADVDAIERTTDVAGVADVDLVSESVPEDPALKGRVFAALDAVCPARTIFTTNTSTLLPSMYAAAPGRPDRFAALHFHLPVWSSNLADVMPHPGTSAETLTTLVGFAERIGQVPCVLKKESSGYLFNAMYTALNGQAITLAANGVGDATEIDKAWTTVMKAPLGPFGMLDHVGIDTAWHITDHWARASGDPQLLANAAWLRSYVDRGWLGVKSGRGFFRYDE